MDLNLAPPGGGGTGNQPISLKSLFTLICRFKWPFAIRFRSQTVGCTQCSGGGRSAFTLFSTAIISVVSLATFLSMFNFRDSMRPTSVIATPGYAADRQDVNVQYTGAKIIGNGSFGVVYQAKLVDTGEPIAIKKVLQDKRYKNRELEIMRRLDHQNIVRLRYFFYSTGDKQNHESLFLNLILEFVPETVYRVNRHYRKMKQALPLIYVKTFMYQLFRALGYIHSLGICHRDVKPQNMLVDPDTAVLKLCDFGSAKQLLRDEPNVSYICSRYYRAPELIFGATHYTTSVDIWSAGCVFGELLKGTALFPGESGVDQLVEIIKILGTPKPEEIQLMNPSYLSVKLPNITQYPWTKVFAGSPTPFEAMTLISQLLRYVATQRISPVNACCHSFFDELRVPATRLPRGKELPPLLNFTERELQSQPEWNRLLIGSTTDAHGSQMPVSGPK